jgi:hypothetical protein
VNTLRADTPARHGVRGPARLPRWRERSPRCGPCRSTRSFRRCETRCPNTRAQCCRRRPAPARRPAFRLRCSASRGSPASASYCSSLAASRRGPRRADRPERRTGVSRRGAPPSAARRSVRRARGGRDRSTRVGE